jgi:hypothetical protein
MAASFKITAIESEGKSREKLLLELAGRVKESLKAEVSLGLSYLLQQLVSGFDAVFIG